MSKIDKFQACLAVPWKAVDVLVTSYFCDGPIIHKGTWCDASFKKFGGCVGFNDNSYAPLPVGDIPYR